MAQSRKPTDSSTNPALDDFFTSPDMNDMADDEETTDPGDQSPQPKTNGIIQTACPDTGNNFSQTTNPVGRLLRRNNRAPSSNDPESGEAWTRWLRRIYVTYESLIVTAAVIVFMLSTCDAYRVPINNDPTDGDVAVPVNGTTVVTKASNKARTTPKSLETNKFKLPTKDLVAMDIFLSVVISIDVLMRMIFCPAIRPWLFSLSTLIDILSLIPFCCELILYEMIYYKAFVNASDWLVVLMKVESYVNVLKVFIVLRLFRVLRRHRGTRVLLYTIRTTFLDLTIIVILILEGALFFGAAIYFTDDNFTDIPTGFWWALITMTTVGYGDLVPSHAFGYAVGMVCVLTGTLLMSYTIPILVNHFILYYDHADQLYMMKQLHRTAKRKARKRTLSNYAQRALTGARGLVNATFTKSMAKVNLTIQSHSSRVEEPHTNR